MVRILVWCFCLSAVLFTDCRPACADDSRAKAAHDDSIKDRADLYTLNLPPMVDLPRKSGYSFEIVDAMMREAGISPTYHAMPWLRSQRTVQRTAQSLIFPLARTQIREPDYHWAVPLMEVTTHFVTLTGLQVTDANKHQIRIGAARNSGVANWLKTHGFKNVFVVTEDGEMALNLLQKGRFDAWCTEKAVALATLQKGGLVDQATFSDVLQTFQLYLATNKDAPSPHIGELAAALQRLKNSGKYDEIIAPYGY